MSPGEELWGHYNAINEQQVQIACIAYQHLSLILTKQKIIDEINAQVQNSASNITPEKLGHYLHKTGSPVIGKVHFTMTIH